MTSSSQDYTITKPGMESHLAKQRVKPLRTYGRRSASTPEARGEPSTKKRRISDSKSRSDEVSTPVTAPQSTKSSEEQRHVETATATVPVKKGSILSYFKPIASSSPITTPNLESEPPSSAASTPPSSPPQTFTRRTKRRRLRIRALGLPSSDAPEPSTDDEAQDTTEEEAGTTEEEGKEANRRIPWNGRNARPDSGQAIAPEEDTERLRRKRKTGPMVQMTLNLSAQAPFSECKVCDTVWNPVIPEDAKYHSRRHAAVLRARKRNNADSL